MADVKAADVAALRKATGAGMMDCKQALTENDGDIEAAKDWLRKKGLAGASKRSGRAAEQGSVDVLVDGNVAALVELTAETDFVAKGADFAETVKKLVELAVKEDRRARAAAVQRLDGRRARDPARGQARRERRARAGRRLRDDRRPARRLQAHPERPRHDRRARRARWRRPGRCRRPKRSRTTSRCTSRRQHRAG